MPIAGGFVAAENARTQLGQITVSLAGPVVGGVGAAAMAVAGRAMRNHDIEVVGLLGLFINMINLAPVFPLDGGRVLKALAPRLVIYFAPLGIVFLAVPVALHPTSVSVVASVPVALWFLGAYQSEWRERKASLAQVVGAGGSTRQLTVAVAVWGLLAAGLLAVLLVQHALLARII